MKTINVHDKLTYEWKNRKLEVKICICLHASSKSEQMFVIEQLAKLASWAGFHNQAYA